MVDKLSFFFYVLDHPIFAYPIILFYAERLKQCKWFFWEVLVIIF